MKLGLSAWSFAEKIFKKDMTLSGFLRYAADHGVDGIELLDCFWEDETHPERIRSELAALGLPVACYSIANDFLVAPEMLPAEMEKVRAGIRIAAQLGTPLLRVFSGDLKEGVSFESGKQTIVECYRALAPEAAAAGVTMVLENHGRVAGLSSQVLQILDEVAEAGFPEALKSNADTGNFLLAGDNPLEAVRALRRRVGYVHYKDFRPAPENPRYIASDGSPWQGIPLGKGSVPLTEITRTLAEAGYAGYLSIEYEGEGVPEEDVAECIRFTREAISGCG